MKYEIAIISHKRPFNVEKILKTVDHGQCAFYVNDGEYNDYKNAGAEFVVECGNNICAARNKAIDNAHTFDFASVQISDDLKKIHKIHLENGKRVLEEVNVRFVVETLINKLVEVNYIYGGVAVTSNRMNYTGEDFSFDKFVACDLICMMPSKYRFQVPLKEDYDMTITQLLEVGGVVRCNNFLCYFPHRDNAGGGNSYRNSETEKAQTDLLSAKWGDLIKPHATREGQISLDYKKILFRKVATQQKFF
jgi:hypothetical protein